MAGLSLFSMTHLHCLLKRICTAASFLDVNVVDHCTFFSCQPSNFSCDLFCSTFDLDLTVLQSCTVRAVIVTLLIKDANLATNKEATKLKERTSLTIQTSPPPGPQPLQGQRSNYAHACWLLHLAKNFGAVSNSNRRNARNGCA